MPTLIFYWLISSVNCMGLRFSSGSAPHSSSLNGSHCSGSARTGSKNVGFSATGKSQFSEIASGSDDREESLGRILKWPNLKVFSFEELISASRRFRYDIQGLVIGKGCFGPVYKGWLDENTLTPAKVGYGMAVAIKMFNQDYFRGFEEWQSEVNFLGRLSHPNLVNLLGYCWDEDKLLLVYEFMPKGSLDYHLFRGNITPLSWNTRLKIAIGAAWGLAFLHASENNVIFSDFKASNILLDGNYNAKISDFGFARWGPFEGESHVSTRVIGTYDYAPPEYIATVLLEILTGMRALDTNRPQTMQNLVEWTKPCLSSKKKLKAIMDAKIEGQYSLEAAWQAAKLTLKCLKSVPEERPSMKDVVEALEAIEAIQNPQFAAYISSTPSAGS
ncbi:hypothetical protein GYH30_044862 [Glycine max]|nr:hypothetical protein GYH30_044862 [Glycine max]